MITIDPFTTLSRVALFGDLGRLQAEGLLRLDGKRAIIPDVEALEEP